MYQQLKTLKKKVEWVLERYPIARNDYKYLYNAILLNFYMEFIVIDSDGDYTVKLKHIKNIADYEHTIRACRKIQRPNLKTGYKGRFHPTDPNILKNRGYMEEEMRKFLGYNPELREIN